MPDLKRQTRARNGIAELLDLFDRDADWLFAEDVLAGFQRAQACGHMEGVRGCDDDGLDLGVRQHRVVIGEGLRRCMRRGHAQAQILGDIADRVEVGVARFGAGLEMRELRNRPAAQHANPQPAIVLARHLFLRIQFKTSCAG